MLYRDHRAGFKESMETVQEFNTLQELYDHVARTYGYPIKIFFQRSWYDPRAGWGNTYEVGAYLENAPNDFITIGYSNGIL